VGWWHGSESDILKDEEWNQEESDHPELNDIPEGTFERPQEPHAMLIVHTVTPPPAKRRKSVPSGMVSSSKSPAKRKRTGVSRRIQGRLQNMLLLPFDVLFLVCPYQPESRVRLCRVERASLSDILRIGAHGSRESRPYE